MDNRVIPAEVEKAVDEAAHNFFDLGRGGVVELDTIRSAVENIYATLNLPAPHIIVSQNPYQLRHLPLFVSILLSADTLALRELRRFTTTWSNQPLFAQLWAQMEEEFLRVDVGKTTDVGTDINAVMESQLAEFDFACDDFLNFGDKVTLVEKLSWFTSYLADLAGVFSRGSFANGGEIVLDPQKRFVADVKSLLGALPTEKFSPVWDYYVNHIVETRVLQFSERTAIGCGAWSGRRMRSASQHRRDWLQRKAEAPNSEERFLTDLTRPPLHEDVPHILWLLACQACTLGDVRTIPLLRDWLILLRSGLCFLFFEKFCFVCAYPTVARVDSQLRFHNENGPALEFSGGQSIYSWHGTIVPSEVIEKREKITTASIERETNAEVRRVMVELFGRHNYLRTVGAHKACVHRDEYGILYRQRFLYDEPLVMVEVTNSTAEHDGTRRRYLLRVPPYIRTARQAVAWTFGMEADAYAPRVQT